MNLIQVDEISGHPGDDRLVPVGRKLGSRTTGYNNILSVAVRLIQCQSSTTEAEEVERPVTEIK